mmetsp:Transcript_17194/g.39086  ORF Transcript_17194/g.39086 Transcript_17194/m.39086 type:complete len:233 (-) Transcript_17194:171-869(-)
MDSTVDGDVPPGRLSGPGCGAPSPVQVPRQGEGILRDERAWRDGLVERGGVHASADGSCGVAQCCGEELDIGALIAAGRRRHPAGAGSPLQRVAACAPGWCPVARGHRGDTGRVRRDLHFRHGYGLEHRERAALCRAGPPPLHRSRRRYRHCRGVALRLEEQRGREGDRLASTLGRPRACGRGRARTRADSCLAWDLWPAPWSSSRGAPRGCGHLHSGSRRIRTPHAPGHRC